MADMNNFAVDLDKVLDDFETNEESPDGTTSPAQPPAIKNAQHQGQLGLYAKPENRSQIYTPQVNTYPYTNYGQPSTALGLMPTNNIIHNNMHFGGMQMNQVYAPHLNNIPGGQYSQYDSGSQDFGYNVGGNQTQFMDCMPANYNQSMQAPQHYPMNQYNVLHVGGNLQSSIGRTVIGAPKIQPENQISKTVNTQSTNVPIGERSGQTGGYAKQYPATQPLVEQTLPNVISDVKASGDGAASLSQQQQQQLWNSSAQPVHTNIYSSKQPDKAADTTFRDSGVHFGDETDDPVSSASLTTVVAVTETENMERNYSSTVNTQTMQQQYYDSVTVQNFQNTVVPRNEQMTLSAKNALSASSSGSLPTSDQPFVLTNLESNSGALQQSNPSVVPCVSSSGTENSFISSSHTDVTSNFSSDSIYSENSQTCPHSVITSNVSNIMLVSECNPAKEASGVEAKSPVHENTSPVSQQQAKEQDTALNQKQLEIVKHNSKMDSESAMGNGNLNSSNDQDTGGGGVTEPSKSSGVLTTSDREQSPDIGDESSQSTDINKVKTVKQDAANGESSATVPVDSRSVQEENDQSSKLDDSGITSQNTTTAGNESEPVVNTSSPAFLPTSDSHEQAAGEREMSPQHPAMTKDSTQAVQPSANVQDMHGHKPLSLNPDDPGTTLHEPETSSETGGRNNAETVSQNLEELNLGSRAETNVTENSKLDTIVKDVVSSVSAVSFSSAAAENSNSDITVNDIVTDVLTNKEVLPNMQQVEVPTLEMGQQKDLGSIESEGEVQVVDSANSNTVVQQQAEAVEHRASVPSPVATSPTPEVAVPFSSVQPFNIPQEQPQNVSSEQRANLPTEQPPNAGALPVMDTKEDPTLTPTCEEGEIIAPKGGVFIPESGLQPTVLQTTMPMPVGFRSIAETITDQGMEDYLADLQADDILPEQGGRLEIDDILPESGMGCGIGSAVTSSTQMQTSIAGNIPPAAQSGMLQLPVTSFINAYQNSSSLGAPVISTPAEDPGLTKVPGYNPSVNGITEAVEHRNKLTGDLVMRGEQVMPRSPSSPVGNHGPSPPKSLQTVAGPSESPQNIQSGARPKELKKSRPNSLLGLSTVSLEPKPNAASPSPDARNSYGDMSRSGNGYQPMNIQPVGPDQMGMPAGQADLQMNGRQGNLIAQQVSVGGSRFSPSDNASTLAQQFGHPNMGIATSDANQIRKHSNMNFGDGVVITSSSDMSLSHDINRGVAGFDSIPSGAGMSSEWNSQAVPPMQGVLPMLAMQGASAPGALHIPAPPGGVSMAGAVPLGATSVPPTQGSPAPGGLPPPSPSMQGLPPPGTHSQPTTQANPGPPEGVRQRRPNSLNIPERGEMGSGSATSPTHGQHSPVRPQSLPIMPTHIGPQPPGDTSAEPVAQSPQDSLQSDQSLDIPPPALPGVPQSASLVPQQFGKVAPIWVPDVEAPNCMQCEARFTFTKRRHHCRACGKVFCSHCCNLKWKLAFLGNKEARVCSRCYQDLIRVEALEKHSDPSSRGPNPANPAEYCSTVPPDQQAAAQAPPPTVLVPSGVLKREGQKSVSKQVMFSDGIRPGGDLTEIDGSPEPSLPANRTSRTTKRVERNPQVAAYSSIDENPVPDVIMEKVRNVDDPDPVAFAINKNLFVLVKVLNLDCCVNRVCWCFSTKGMVTVGQQEVVIILECLPDEKEIPRDIFLHLQSIYVNASKGNTVDDMSHTIITEPFLGSRDHCGFLFIRPTFQCLQHLILPQPPYLFGILLQKWEIPWAKVFPLRLVLRLGAEFRYYPCPLVSIRDRKPVFGEIGHTILNLLADFRNYQYGLQQVKAATIHMEDKQTTISFPRNRYDQVMKVVSNSNDHVMALGTQFSMKADSHLVCIQNEHGTYHTQAINIQNKPRKITGASFVVFNGALKSSSGLRAKSSIVEDGLMVQILSETMAELKQSLRDMRDYTIDCGSVDAAQPEEQVLIRWVDEDKAVNQGVKSPIDGMAMDGIDSIHIHNGTDYMGEQRSIRWTEVFFIKQDESGSPRGDPVDLSRLADMLAGACCIALTPHLDALRQAGLTRLGLRASISNEMVGYEAGAKGEKLPDFCMNDLDNELVPVIHSAAANSQDSGPVVLELIFHIIE